MPLAVEFDVYELVWLEMLGPETTESFVVDKLGVTVVVTGNFTS